VVKDQEGKVVRMMASILDISERKDMEIRLRASEELYRSLVELSPDLIAIHCEGKWVFMNATGARLLGGSAPSEFIGKEVLDIVHPDYREIVRERVHHLTGEKQSTPIREQQLIRVDGTALDVEGAGVPIVYNGKPAAQVFIRDISEKKRTEKKIQLLNEELEQKVLDRTAALKAALEELESFSYSVSHDLRAPLRHVQGFVEMLSREVGDTLSAKGRHYMRIISDSSREMGVLIDDLLAFSRMGQTQMTQVRVNLNDLLEEVRRQCEGDCQGRNIAWKIPPLPLVVGDPAMLKLVLTNLLANALKFTRPRNPAEIEIGTAGEENGHLIFFVHDNGVGFDQHYAHKLFGVFQRLHSSDTFEGTGIGLANVRRIITRHGGRTWAEGRLDEGATFYFSLPSEEEPEKNAG
jgi:PAS domain S-box-containing protein